MSNIILKLFNLIINDTNWNINKIKFISKYHNFKIAGDKFN